MEFCKIKIINKSGNPMPRYMTEGSAGMDLCADLKDDEQLDPMEIKMIPTGLYISLPVGYEAQIRARSGLSSKYGLTMVNGIGTIDSDYRGEIKVPLINLGGQPYKIKPGERICQMVINKYVHANLDEVEILDETDRSHGGFGHSGK
ncbi:MAG: dUTP diphosphatase [Eubacteriaceae bacterium]|nr:dUTP diphosphatase [Eubacteriaceae bacterium]